MIEKVVEILYQIGASRKLIAAGILHDIGKPVVATVDLDESRNPEYANGHISYSFHGHEEKGYEKIVGAEPFSSFSSVIDSKLTL